MDKIIHVTRKSERYIVTVRYKDGELLLCIRPRKPGEAKIPAGSRGGVR